MKYERVSLRWLPLSILTCGLCGLGGAFLTAGATYWNVEAGLYAGIAGAVFGVLGWLVMGIRIPTYASTALEMERIHSNDIFAMGMQWRQQAEEARVLLQRARPYVGSAPLEGSLTIEQDIKAFLYRAEEAKND